MVKRSNMGLLRQQAFASKQLGNGLATTHLFEPFYTTKPSGKGLGLGLAISSSIIQAMNGQLSGHNGAHGGAVFEVRIPLLEKS